MNNYMQNLITYATKLGWTYTGAGYNRTIFTKKNMKILFSDESPLTEQFTLIAPSVRIFNQDIKLLLRYDFSGDSNVR